MLIWNRFSFLTHDQIYSHGMPPIPNYTHNRLTCPLTSPSRCGRCRAPASDSNGEWNCLKTQRVRGALALVHSRPVPMPVNVVGSYCDRYVGVVGGHKMHRRRHAVDGNGRRVRWTYWAHFTSGRFGKCALVFKVPSIGTNRLGSTTASKWATHKGLYCCICSVDY